MIKIFKICLIPISVFIFCFFATPAHALNNWTYEQTFESPWVNNDALTDYDSWSQSLGTGMVVITADSPDEGTQHVKAPGGNAEFAQRTITEIVSGTMYFSAKTENVDTYFTFLMKDEGSATAIYFYMNPEEANNWAVLDSVSGWERLEANTGGTYYRFGIQFETGAGGWEGLANDDFNMNVNGGSWQGPFNMYDAPTGMLVIEFNNQTEADDIWFDYISYEYEPAVAATAAAGEEFIWVSQY